MTDMFYTGTQDNVIAANNQININCGFPDGITTTWAIPQASYSDPTLWFIAMPPSNGYRNGIVTLTQAQMIAGVSSVTETPYDPSWFPPYGVQ
jgi:hypothetical protein